MISLWLTPGMCRVIWCAFDMIYYHIQKFFINISDVGLHLGRDLAASIQFPIHFRQDDNADYRFMYLIWNHLNFSMI